jgi:hypothetical protein
MPVAEAAQRARPELDARLRVVRPVALDEAAVAGVEDHARRLVEAVARLGHVDAEAGVLAPRQAAAEAEHGPAAREVVEQDDLLCDAQRVVPRQDEGAGGQLHPLRARRQPGEELRVVGTGGVVEEVVLDDEHLVVAERLGELGEAHLGGDVRGVVHRTGVVLEDQLHRDVHGLPSRHAARAPGNRSSRQDAVRSGENPVAAGAQGDGAASVK